MTILLLIVLCVALAGAAAYAFVSRTSFAERLKSAREENLRLDAEMRRAGELARHDSEQARTALDALSVKLESAVAENKELISRCSELNARLEFLDGEKQKMERETADRFKLLADEVLRANSEAIKSRHEDSLRQLLNPLRENIEQFKRTFAESYEKESRDRFALDKHIEQLVALNNSLSREAQELTRALKGNSKVQGDWGEMILESILERSGLEKDREFVIQKSTTNDEGASLRADVVVNYPDGRCAVIDSKVSLVSYVESVNSSDPAEQQACLKAHVQSVRRHIDELKNKNYQDYIGDRKADFVMMFIPNEGAYIAAMQQDNNLWQYAYDNRVVVISPTHLISVLKLLEQLWQHDRQSRNAIEIARKAGVMYDKFTGFLTDLTKIRRALDNADAAYSEAVKKLETGKGNLIRSALTLKEMGAKASKNLPQPFDAIEDGGDDLQPED